MNLLCNFIATIPERKMKDEPEKLYKMAEIRIGIKELCQ